MVIGDLGWRGVGAAVRIFSHAVTKYPGPSRASFKGGTLANMQKRFMLFLEYFQQYVHICMYSLTHGLNLSMINS